MPLTAGFNHVASLTPDLDRFEAWYQEVFGAVTTFEMAADGDHPRMATVDVGGGSFLNVFEVPPESIVGDRRSIGARGAIDHFGFAVADLEALESLRSRLVGVGADVHEIQRLGSEWSLFFRDVDGMELEVCAPAAHHAADLV